MEQFIKNTPTLKNSLYRVVESIFTLFDTNMESPDASTIDMHITMLKDKNVDNRRKAQEALVTLGKHHPEVVADILPLLDVQNARTRFLAAEIFGKIGDNAKAIIAILRRKLQAEQDEHVAQKITSVCHSLE